jgi:hypothetical protein
MFRRLVRRQYGYVFQTKVRHSAAHLHGTLGFYLRGAFQEGAVLMLCQHAFLFLGLRFLGLRFFPLFFFLSFGGLRCFFL